MATFDDDEKRLKVQIKERDLLCVNGCGFYGTPQWGNRCSKCWRAHQVVEKRNQDFFKNRTLLSFDSFQERRKSSTESRSMSIKKIFKAPILGTTSEATSRSQPPVQFKSPSPTSPRKRDLSPESTTAREALTEFLVESLPKSMVNDIVKMSNLAASRIHELRVSPDELSELLQQFFQFLNDKLNKSPFFNGNEEEGGSSTAKKTQVKVEDVMEQVEKFICISCYSKLFCFSADEEIADESLQDRIRSLHWVTAGFLETRLDFKNISVREKLDQAIAEMIEINGKRTTEEKLDKLIKCSHTIFDALNESGAPKSADEFLPVLIFVLLRGNPPLIQSNVKYISRFALPSRVMSGESGYFFTNLSCALQFVQDMNHNSLKMERSEFEAYTSGNLAPPLSVVNCACNQALYDIEGAYERVKQLLDIQRILETKIDVLEKRITDESNYLTNDFETVAALFPSESYQKIREATFQEEKLLQEVSSIFSSSSDSGVGTISTPSTPQPHSNDPPKLTRTEASPTTDPAQ